MINFTTDFFLQSKWKIAYNSKSTDFFFFVNIICHNAVLMDEWVNLRGNVLFLFLFLFFVFCFFLKEKVLKTLQIQTLSIGTQLISIS